MLKKRVLVILRRLKKISIIYKILAYFVKKIIVNMKYDLLVGVTVKLLIQLIRIDEKYLILEWNSSHIQ